ncbi:MAG: DNA polymerase III subunit delta' [Lachnospiraceae bacterium]|nr:DNA polymerase III subunit delta' [Lachnospiraceae bacterium]
MAEFKQIIGHEQIIQHMQNAIRQKKISHAYLLCGESGSGKRLVAEAFAKAVLCEEGGIEACGKCKSCKQAESGNHPDIRVVVREKATLGVKEIREQVTADVQIKPYSSEYKIYLIDEAEKMTEEAQNALLKTIEEPPEYAVFLLMVDRQELLLSTVLSRCVLLPFYPVATGKIKQFLMEEKGVPDYLAESAAAFSGGLVGRAVQYTESEAFTEQREEVLHLVKYVDQMTMAEVMENVKLFASKKDAATEYLDMILLWYRDVLMYKATKDINALMFANEPEAVADQAKKRSFENLQGIVEALEQVKQRLKSNVNFETALELLLLYMKED